ncbi:MAG: hypothetical protein Q8K75_00470 [Chlamydiales bacterium]|nr:hypothetical protein [Chlamydiales bacterium]
MAISKGLLVVSALALAFNASTLLGDEPYWPSQGAPDYNDEAPQQQQENNPGQNEANAIYRSYQQPERQGQNSFHPSQVREGDDEGEREADQLFNSYRK